MKKPLTYIKMVLRIYRCHVPVAVDVVPWAVCLTKWRSVSAGDKLVDVEGTKIDRFLNCIVDVGAENILLAAVLTRTAGTH